MRQTSYKAKKNVPRQPQLVMGLFAQENGQPFTLIEPLVVATAITMLVYNHFIAGTFGNNLACNRCGKCSLVVRRETLDTGLVECLKCFKTERFVFEDAYQFYMLMQPEKVRREHSLSFSEEEALAGKAYQGDRAAQARIELPMIAGGVA